MDEARKDLIVGATGLAATLAKLSAVALAALPATVALGIDVVNRKARRRAEQIIERMVMSDEQPAEFSDWLNARLAEEDEDVVFALRSLLVSALDAVSPACLEAMSRIGRQYLRRQIPAWIARAWLRTLCDLSDPELALLREIARVGSLAQQHLQTMGLTPQVQLELDRTAGRDRLLVRGTPDDLPHTAFADGVATRLIDLFVQQQIGRPTYVSHQGSGRTPAGTDKLTSKELFDFAPGTFDVLVAAMLLG